MNRLIALFSWTSFFPFVFALIGWLRGHVVQVLEREKLNKSELLDNFPRLIQAWTGPLGCIMVAQREVATAAAPTCHSAYVFYTEARDRAHRQLRNEDHFLLRVAMRILVTEAIKNPWVEPSDLGVASYFGYLRPSHCRGLDLLTNSRSLRGCVLTFDSEGSTRGKFCLILEIEPIIQRGHWSGFCQLDISSYISEKSESYWKKDFCQVASRLSCGHFLIF